MNPEDASVPPRNLQYRGLDAETIRYRLMDWVENKALECEKCYFDGFKIPEASSSRRINQVSPNCRGISYCAVAKRVLTSSPPGFSSASSETLILNSHCQRMQPAREDEKTTISRDRDPSTG